MTTMQEAYMAADLERKDAEVKRLRELLTKESIEAYREHVIEECAQLVESHFGGSIFATAIRKLKEKP